MFHVLKLILEIIRLLILFWLVLRICIFSLERERHNIQNSITNFIFANKLPFANLNFPLQNALQVCNHIKIGQTSQPCHQMRTFETHFIQIFISFFHQIWWNIVVLSLSENTWILFFSSKVNIWAVIFIPSTTFH